MYVNQLQRDHNQGSSVDESILTKAKKLEEAVGHRFLQQDLDSVKYIHLVGGSPKEMNGMNPLKTGSPQMPKSKSTKNTKYIKKNYDSNPHGSLDEFIK